MGPSPGIKGSLLPLTPQRRQPAHYTDVSHISLIEILPHHIHILLFFSLNLLVIESLFNSVLS